MIEVDVPGLGTVEVEEDNIADFQAYLNKRLDNQAQEKELELQPVISALKSLEMAFQQAIQSIPTPEVKVPKIESPKVTVNTAKKVKVGNIKRDDRGLIESCDLTVQK